MSDILITDDGPVRTIRINRPDKKNALTLPMYDAMSDAIGHCHIDKSIRSLIIAGQPDVFCAGNDIGDFMAMAERGALGQPIVRFLHVLARNEVPVVAAVNGNAVGVGCTMLMHCDQVILGANARLATPFVGLGLVPEAASSLLAPRLMGPARAFALLVMGQPLNAAEAKEAGLANAVVDPAETEAAALSAARKIAALPVQAVLASRRLIRGPVEEIIGRIDDEAEAFKLRLQSPEARAAFAAFLARKK